MPPQVRSSSEVHGEPSLPPTAGVPIGGILGDQQAALTGQACFQPGEVKGVKSVGTGGLGLLKGCEDRYQRPQNRSCVEERAKSYTRYRSDVRLS